MKKILVVLCVLVLSSCAFNIRDPEDIHFNSLPEIYAYMKQNFHYISDGQYERFEAPMETIERGGGDCDSYAIFVCYFAHRDLGMEANMIAIHLPQGDHAIVQLDGQYYESMYYKKYRAEELNIFKRYTLDQVLMLCKLYGSRNVQ